MSVIKTFKSLKVLKVFPLFWYNNQVSSIKSTFKAVGELRFTDGPDNRNDQNLVSAIL